MICNTTGEYLAFRSHVLEKYLFLLTQELNLPSQLLLISFFSGVISVPKRSQYLQGLQDITEHIQVKNLSGRSQQKRMKRDFTIELSLQMRVLQQKL